MYTHDHEPSYDPILAAHQNLLRQYHPPESWFEDPPCAPTPMLRLDPPPPPPPGPPDYNDLLMTPEYMQLAMERIHDLLSDNSIEQRVLQASALPPDDADAVLQQILHPECSPASKELSQPQPLDSFAANQGALPLEQMLTVEPATRPEPFAAESLRGDSMDSLGHLTLEQIIQGVPQAMPDPAQQQRQEESPMSNPYTMGGLGQTLRP